MLAHDKRIITDTDRPSGHATTLTPPIPTTLHVSCIRDTKTFASLRREWDLLLQQSNAALFNSWDWLYPWYRRLGSNRELLILTARDLNGLLVGLLPLSISEIRALGTTVRRLAFLGDTHVGSDYLDIIATGGQEERVARLFSQTLCDLHGEWDTLDLVDLDESSPTVKVLCQRFSRDNDFECRVTNRSVCPFEIMNASKTFDNFLRGTSRRDNYLRRLNWFARQADFSIEVNAEAHGLERSLADFFHLHALRWANDGGSRGITSTSVEAFHRDATQYMAERNVLRLYTLRLGAHPLASVYAMMDRGKFYYYQAGYDPAHRSKSAGLVLVGHTFREAIEAGTSEYDFLRGTEKYKSDWTTLQRNTVAVRIWQRGSRGALPEYQERLAKALRRIAKRILPNSVIRAIR